MANIRLTQYIHRPNKTELGIGNTHECYMLVGADIDMSEIFPPSKEIIIHDAISQKEYALKSSNYREFRINQMGDIYRDYNVIPGDEIIINQMKNNYVSDISFSVRKYNRVVLLVKKGVAEINNIERLKSYEIGNEKYEVMVSDRGNQNKLLISFHESKPKRADSPTLTEYYNVNLNGERMPNGTYYLTLGSDKNTIANLPKSDYNSIEFDDSKLLSIKMNEPKHSVINNPLQQIFYGAPGTGKSYEINDITKLYSTIRTTFHPDSDYSTFVGAYKPTMEEAAVQVVPVVTTNGISLEQNNGTYKEKRITYQYVKQAFLKTYLSAWQKYAEGDETTEPQFLIIEEINRGNCAQIFGDLFQLLDRSDDGFSTYPIEADTDLQSEISKAFGKGGEYALADGFDIEGVVPGYDNITKAVKEGTVLLLPNNLYIWATMNTSDQSLFPIDSAFKRRWDWKYVKIADAHKDWTIRCGNEYCDWWTFIVEINKKISKETSCDDKKLGYFFCKPKKGETTINESKFVGKVLFYLWNDVFKDGDTSLFKVSDNDEDEVTFEAFYTDNGAVNVTAIRKFLVAVVGENNIKTEEGTDYDPILDDGSDGIDYTKYSFDGEPRLSKKDLGYKIVMKYINEHSDEPFAQLQNELAFDDSVANKYRYKGVLAKTEDIDGSYIPCFGEEQTSSDGVKFKVLTWWNKYNIDFIINFAKNQGWVVDKVTE